MTELLKTRFCPSPTGLIHLGNTRTALFSALLAHGANAHGKQGVFLFRIEDTDRTRSYEEYTQAMLDDLHWLGLRWQEGACVGEVGKAVGDAGPYWQAQRQAIYARYYQTLEDAGQAYPCFCSEEQLAMSRKVQRTAGKPPRYAGTCRNLTQTEVAAKLAEGLKPTLRFRVPRGETIQFTDFVKGRQRFVSDDIGDFIIRRTDGTAPFMYANAIDDALMGVTHAMRGDDHLTNTPRQLMLLAALELPVPAYGHISLIMGPDGAPLSKRHGSRSLQELRQTGFLPEALLNYLARLGHYYENPAYMSYAELAANFKLESLSSAPARYDENQLLYWQKESVAQISSERFWDWLDDKTKKLVPAEQQELFVDTVRANVTFPAEALTWAQVFFNDKIHFDDESKAVLDNAGSEFFAAALAAIDMHGADFKAVSNHVKEQSGVKGKALFQPLRIALTGEQHGPEMAKVFALLGVDKIKQRLQR